MSMRSSSALQEIQSWNLNCVKQALRNNGLGDCCAAFERHNIDGEDLLNLTEGKLALWKRDLTLPSIRNISKFVTELKTSPEKYLLKKSARPNFPVKPAFRPAVPFKKPELYPAPNRNVDAAPTQTIHQPDSRSPGSDTEAWDTDFDDDHDEPDAPGPAPAPKQFPLVPVPSRLFGTVESSRPVKPATPSRPNALAMRTASNRGNAPVPSSFPSPAHPAPGRPPGVTDLSRPPIADAHSLLSKINLSESFCDDDEYAEYTELDIEDDLKRGEKPSSGFQPFLPPREPHQMQPPVNIPERSPYFNNRNVNRSPTPNIPHIPQRKILNEVANEPPALPSREHVFLANLALLKKQNFTNHVYPNDDSHSSSLLDLDGDGYISDDYEAIQDPNNDYMPPIQVSNPRPGQPWLAPPASVSLPPMEPLAPRATTLPRRVSNASPTFSPSSKLSDQLRSAMTNFSTLPRGPSPSPSSSEHREKTPTPELQSKPPPPPPSVNQKPAAFPGVQRPLPPTPPPPRLGQTYTQMPWYHKVDRKRGEELLRNGEDGSFLLRPSKRTEHPLTLTMWYSERMYHINLRQRADQKYSLGTEKTNELSFNSVEELVQYYQREALMLHSNGERTGKSILTSTPPQQHV